jgi:hypothetical protein
MSSEAIRVFLSHADEDEALRKSIETHLKPFVRKGLITIFDRSRAPVGKERGEQIRAELERAEIILLLVSPSFIASDECSVDDVTIAMERHDAGAALVVPILLKAATWKSEPFGELQPLPRNEIPVIAWKHRDEALNEIAQEFSLLLKELRKNPPVDPRKKLRIVFLSANAISAEPIDTEEEMRRVRRAIEQAEHRDSVELFWYPAARPDDVLLAITKHSPDVLHFSGHGFRSGQLALKGGDRSARFVSAAAVRRACEGCPSVRLLFLNACYSAAEAEMLVHGVDAVVSMSDAVSDNGAAVFAGAFYRALACGRSLGQALADGRTALHLEGHDEQETPQLFVKKGVDAGSIHLIASRGSRF